MRVLAVDPGEKHIGLAVSDPTGTIARPLSTFSHTARAADAAHIARQAAEQQAELILVGQALDAQGLVGPQGRRAARLAEALRQHTPLPVELFDESFSTQAAARAPGSRWRRRGQMEHAVAAAAILQSYLDAHTREPGPPPPAG